MQFIKQKILNRLENPVISSVPKIYDKRVRNDGNIEYTVKNNTGLLMAQDLTKILCNTSGEILAYIDIQQIACPLKDCILNTITWFGIQEFHPELIGNFTQQVVKKGMEYRFDATWEYDESKHLYKLIQHGPFPYGTSKNWFQVGIGNIRTNIDIHDEKSYEYNTCPTEPVSQIKKLTQKILLSDGIITRGQIYRQKTKQIFQNQKQNKQKG